MGTTKLYNNNLVSGAAIRDGNGKRIDTTYVKKDEITTDIKFTIKSTLTNCTLSNTDVEVDYGASYENVITPDSKCDIKTITISMGGIDITDTAWKSSTSTISIEKVTGNLYITGTISSGYTISYVNGEHITFSNKQTSVDDGASFTTSLTVNEGYTLDNITVTMSGADITTTSVSGNVVTIAKAIGDISIISSVSQIAFTITQGDSDGVSCIAPATIGYGEDLEIDVTVLEGYQVFDERITVTEGGADKVFTYADSKITVASVKGNIVYAIDAAATYTVSYVFNNVTSSNKDTETNDQATYTTTLSFDEATYNDIDIEITMGGKDVTNSVYDLTTHVVTIVNPTGNISIHAEAVATIKKVYDTKIDLTSQSWKFNKLRDASTETFDTTMMASGYDDSSWDTITIPHDWSSYNSFSTSVTGNEYESGWLAGGDAVYRTTITVPSDYSGHKVYIHFDGVYMMSEVYVNGVSVGTNKNGYIPFTFDITDNVNYGATNTIAVAVSNHIPSSRWYSGSGIFREAWISMNEASELGNAHITVTTPNLATEKAGTVSTNIVLELENTTSSDITLSEVTAEVYQEWDGTKVGTQTITSQTLAASTTSKFDVTVGVAAPILWTIHDNSDTIRLYKAVVSVKYINNSNEYLIQSNEELFGYRYITWDSEGFYLNGTKTFLKGMCMHHDNGPIGSETNYSASERKLRILKDMGCNTIRCTHNPESRVFLECAARMGFMIIEELFDGWRYPKNGNNYDYSRYFSADNSYIDVVVNNTIKRDINNPAIIMWSMGNEVSEGTSYSLDSQYVTDCQYIHDAIKAIDTTRAITQGTNKPTDSYAHQMMAIQDIIGVNYGDDSEYASVRAASSDGVSFSNKCIYGSETCSPFYTRGIYEVSSSNGYFNCFDYTNSEQSQSHTTWGDASCVSLTRHTLTYPWLAGTMPWTGFDYIGEPTPVNSNNVRSSFFGVVDLCGIPKDAYYFYKSQWTTAPMIHIVPEDWTIWTEGATIPVWVYSNCASVKLHMNGVELTPSLNPSTSTHYAYEYSVTFESGTLVATGYDASGNVVAQDVRYSANALTKCKLYPDKTQVARDGSLVFVEYQSQDKYGVVVPRDASNVAFTCIGGTIVATDNGYPECLEDLRNTTQTSFTGKCVVIVKPDGTSATVQVTATLSDDPTITSTVEVAQGDSNIYASKDSEFIDPINPPMHVAVTELKLSKSVVNLDNGANAVVTVTKVPASSSSEIVITSVPEGFTAVIDNTTNIITITNTINDASGIITIQCDDIQKSITVAAGSAVTSTCTMTINGTEYSEDNKTIYVQEYLPVSFTSDKTITDISITFGNDVLTYDSTNSLIHGVSNGDATISATLDDGSVYDFDIVSEVWSNSDGDTISDVTISSTNSDSILSRYTYPVNSIVTGELRCQITDKSLREIVEILEVPASVTVTSDVLAEFGTDATGTRKAYIVKTDTYDSGDLKYNIEFSDDTAGWHYMYIRNANGTGSFSYKSGTLSCTSVTFDKTEVNITSDATNNQSIYATILPADTTDEPSWSVATGNVVCSAGALFGVKNGTDTVTCTCGSCSATATVNISNITEDETILAMNATFDGTSTEYYSGSSALAWDNSYTLIAEFIPNSSQSAANVISFGQNINKWAGVHYHIYYPATGTQGDTTTLGICIAMGTASPKTLFATADLVGENSDRIIIAQNSNGLWINGVNASAITVTEGSFATIQALTSVYIGSMEGSSHFNGTLVQLRAIKLTDLNSTYATNGLSAEDLEDISINGFDFEKYLAIYENAEEAALLLEDEGFSVSPLTLSDIESVADGESIKVLLANPNVSNGYVFGYTTATAGYSNGSVSLDSASGFATASAMKLQVEKLLDEDTYTNNFVFTLTKTGTDTCTIRLVNGYSPVGETSTLSWSTTPIEYTISDLSSVALSSTASMCDGYSESNCLRLMNPSGYYLNAQGEPDMAKFTTTLAEWSVWCMFKIDD